MSLNNVAGTRYGASLRKHIKKMEVSQQSKYFVEHVFIIALVIMLIRYRHCSMP